MVGRVSVVTCYRLDGPGIESRWGGEIFLHQFGPILGPTQPPIPWVPGHPGVQRPGRGVNHPLPSNHELKQEQRYISAPLGLHGLFQVELIFQ